MEVVCMTKYGETVQFIQEWINPHEQGINILNRYVGIKYCTRHQNMAVYRYKYGRVGNY